MRHRLTVVVVAVRLDGLPFTKTFGQLPTTNTMPPADAKDCRATGLLREQRVALVGRLAGMSKRAAQQLVREAGGAVVDPLDDSATLAVVGEAQWPLADGGGPEDLLEESARRAVDEGRLRIITETQLWHQLGLVDADQHVHRLYTPAMLASLLGVPVAVIRRWRRRGLITPTREVRKLPYFDYQQVAAARRLAELLAAGVSPRAIERKLAALARLLPGVERPLAQLSIIVEGRQLLLRQGDGLIEPGGQLRLDFGAWEANEREACRMDQEAAEEVLSQTAADEDAGEAESPDRLLSAAEQLEDDGQLEAAVGMYRAALMADGPRPEVCFQLAELLYRMGDVTAACERYYVAVELDEDYVEARANLGCVLAELGQLELAVAAFEGALAYHHEYPDVHYHLARTLAELGRRDQAARHWRRFLELAPDSPWAAEARQQVE